MLVHWYIQTHNFMSLAYNHVVLFSIGNDNMKKSDVIKSKIMRGGVSRQSINLLYNNGL